MEKCIKGRIQKLAGTWKMRHMTLKSYSSGAFSGLFRVWMTVYSLIHSWLRAVSDCLFSPSASEISGSVHCFVLQLWLRWANTLKEYKGSCIFSLT